MTRTKSSRALLSVVLAVLMAAAFMPSLTYSSFAATAKKATKVTKLNHTGAKVYGKVGSKYTLKYKLSPSKLTSSAQKTVWKSSDSSVVKVIAKAGKHATVKVKGVGTAKITVYTKANTKAKAVWSFKTKEPAEAAAPTIDTSKVQTTYGLATEYNKVASSITKADLLKNVTAKDASGKDVTVSIASIKDVSTGDSINTYDEIKQVAVNNQAKHFEVTYTATDANGKTATKTVVVTVKNLDPEVTANNFSVAIDANHAPLTEDDLINKGITAVNDYESFPADTKAEAKTPAAFKEAVKGNKVNTIDVAKITDASGKSLEKTDKSVTPAKTTADPSQIVLDKAGTYNITYKVTDYLGASVEKTVTMTVANNQAPTIATTEATVYASSATPEADVLDQITYNDAEDGQNVKLSKDAKDAKVEIKFIDANGNVLDPKTDANFYKKVAKAYVINVKDSNGAYAQTKLIDIKVADGIVLTAKDQSVDVDIKAPATTTIDPMQFITATLNGAAYTLDNPATTKGGNTTVTIKDSTGKGVPSISAKEAGTYTVTYTVTDKDTKLTATKTITVKVVDKDAEAKAAKDKAVSDAIKAIQAIQLVDKDNNPVKTADLQAQVDTAQKAYDAVKALDDPALLSKISTKKLDDAKKELQKRADDAKAANDAELAIKAVVSAATPSQGTDYTYKGTITVNGTNVTATAKDDSYMKKPENATTPAVADLAQFLGGLYKSGNVTGIKFNGTTYTWNQEGTLKGSNWTNGTKTLVEAIADAYTNATTKPDKVTLTLVNGSAEVEMTYTISIAK